MVDIILRDAKGCFVVGHKRIKNSGRRIGSIAWNRGLKLNSAWRKKLSESHIGKKPWNYGKHGQIPWNKGLTWRNHPSLFRPGSRSDASERLRGNKNPNWKGGTLKETQKIRSSPEMLYWAKMVKKRDNFTCQLCGEKKRLVSHHIKAFSDYKYYRFRLSNGITLCVDCHKWIHGGIDCG